MYGVPVMAARSHILTSACAFIEDSSACRLWLFDPRSPPGRFFEALLCQVALHGAPSMFVLPNPSRRQSTITFAMLPVRSLEPRPCRATDDAPHQQCRSNHYGLFSSHLRFQHFLSMCSHHGIQNHPDLLAAIQPHGNHTLQPCRLHFCLHDQDIDLILFASTRSDRQERQLQLLQTIQIQQRVRTLVIARVRCRRARRARRDVTPHGNPRVNQRQRRRVQARGQQPAVLREDVQVDGDRAVRVQVREQRRLERRADGVLQLGNALVAPRASLALRAGEACDADLDLDAGGAGLRSAGAAAPLLFLRPRDRADDFGVAELEIAGAVGGRLRGDLSVDPAQLVPSSSVQSEVRKRVGRRVERHDCLGRRAR
nr:hypothetical protein CFP56_03848 [Quercus suber]